MSQSCSEVFSFGKVWNAPTFLDGWWYGLPQNDRLDCKVLVKRWCKALWHRIYSVTLNIYKTIYSSTRCLLPPAIELMNVPDRTRHIAQFSLVSMSRLRWSLPVQKGGPQPFPERFGDDATFRNSCTKQRPALFPYYNPISWQRCKKYVFRILLKFFLKMERTRLLN